MSEERRANPRIPAYLPGEIELAGGQASVAITHDLSTTGLLVLARHELEIGSAVKLKVAFHHEEVHITGKVVRREDVDPELGSIWRYQVGVAVDPSPVFDRVLAELKAHPE